MDDHSNVIITRDFWQAPSLDYFTRSFSTELVNGRFRPVYFIWLITAYTIGACAPFLVYFLITLAGLSLLPLWGISLDQAFNNGKRSPFLLWVYPLSFFVFTPFWNIFMYISLQEKFVYLFCTPAIFFFLKSYADKKWWLLLPALIFTLLATMGKETGVALLMSFGAYAFVDALIFKRDRNASWMIWSSNTILFSGYFLFVQWLMRSYSERYASNSNIQSMISKLLAAPVYIKIILLLCVAGIAWPIIKKCLDKTYEEKGGSLFAWLTLFYILLLTPWGYQSYLLSPLAPFLLATALPFSRPEIICAGTKKPSAAFSSGSFF